MVRCVFVRLAFTPFSVILRREGGVQTGVQSGVHGLLGFSHGAEIWK